MSSSGSAPASWRLMVVVPAVLAFLSMIGPFSIDTPFPAFAQMGADLGASAAELQLVVSVYLGCFALMSVLHGPISDALGRRPVMLASLTVYVVASVGCAVAPTLGWLLVGRAVQGLSAGGATIVSRTVIRDLFTGATAQRLMSRVAVIFGIAPAIGPVLGGAMLRLGEWPAVFCFQVGLGIALAVAVLTLLPESLPVERRSALRVRAVLASLRDVARVAAFQRLAWATALIFGAQFLYIGGASIFVVDILGQGELDYWKLFVPMIGAMSFGSWLCGRAAGRMTARRLTSIGCAVALLGGVVGVVVAATPAGTRLPWAVVGLGLLALGNGMTYPTLQLVMLDLFLDRLGAVASLSMFLSLALNAVAATALTPHLGGSALAFAAAAGVGVVAGQLLWLWHCVLEDRDCAVRRAAAGSPAELS
ncbi:multidrug effflux MFS transporter [Nocardioides sp. zg-536]|uniref:Multidrug effflux MFS transporter n=1 Tax=Nocardioides faecalis TaxID=2803858 RepID=A0A938Y9L8_9ACTN|nr:multidrug effflux MFS transporter [Nocardioides faecalis]MBM9460380.1 multidrug effflux MFS transporter [Nocardioides faecalis]MBS4751305.1 multidrug effflux MFS transporter [Nocardioides faecalis]QVI59793.1 multidrug effflux MFS transporter [Nocardioides faecalis]